jgi:hypothetical protein
MTKRKQGSLGTAPFFPPKDFIRPAAEFSKKIQKKAQITKNT